jgi:arsenate reductase (thioredoxin)
VTDRPLNALFLCTGNSARSILAEAILNRLGAGKFVAYSAGSHPKGTVHAETIRLLHNLGYDTAGFRSKSWGEFATPGIPRLDFVFTVCDDAAGETCPVWPGQLMTALSRRILIMRHAFERRPTREKVHETHAHHSHSLRRSRGTSGG